MRPKPWILIGLVFTFSAALSACGGGTIVYGGGPPPISYTVNSDNDADDGTCDSTHCSLREAIHAANAFPGFNGIYFDIPGGGVRIIQTAGLPAVTDATLIDATTQPGYSGAPLIELRPAGAHTGTGLSVRGEGSSVKGFSIVNFNLGVEIRDGGNIWIIGDYIGLLPDGATIDGNQTGVQILSGNNHVGGGAQLAYRNVISGNAGGVDVACGSDGNRIQNNYIGLNAGGTVAAPNSGFGVRICGSSNNIGGAGSLEGNVISGNGGNGVEFLASGGYAATGNQLSHNRIGTDPTGVSGLGNAGNGVRIEADGNILDGNTVSGNMLSGVLIDGHQGTLITGNFIGTNSSGTAHINNVGSGVTLRNASNNLIGGGDAGAGNVISGNMNNGIEIVTSGGGAATANLVQGNKIGTNAGGTAEIANQTGIFITGSGNTIGGPSISARNLVSGNYGDGIRIGGNQNVVQNNYIGTDVSGNNPLGNQYNGVRLDDGASNNSIGTDSAGNFVAFNAGVGVWVAAGAGNGNLIQFNSIHDNGGLGIALGAASPPLVNDPGDADTGPNTLINSPVMVSAVSSYNSQFKAALNGVPGAVYRVDFFTNAACDPSGYGEGHRLVKHVSVTTDLNGKGLAIADFPSTYFDDGNFVTATATDMANNTSEFSNCIAVAQAAPTPNGTATLTPTPKQKSFFLVQVSDKDLFSPSRGCNANELEFRVQVAEPAKVAGVWLFVRLRNKDGDGLSAWSGALVMRLQGSGWYSFTLTAEDVPDYLKYRNAWVQYQFVAYDKAFGRVATSDVYSDVVLSPCRR
jgi:CSLREA domain-containing protein